MTFLNRLRSLIRSIKKKKGEFHVFLLVFYIAFLLISICFVSLSIASIDNFLIVALGLLNTVIAYVFFSTRFLKSMLIGFLISGLSMIYSYLFCFLVSSIALHGNAVFLPVVSNAFIQTSLWIVIHVLLKEPYNDKVLLFLSILVVMIMYNPYNIWDYTTYEKYRTGNKSLMNVKIIDLTTGTPIEGDTIEISIKQPPTYTIKTIQTLSKKTTDKYGSATFRLFKWNDYDILVRKKNGSFDYFELLSKDIINGKTIEFKTVKTDGKHGYPKKLGQVGK